MEQEVRRGLSRDDGEYVGDYRLSRHMRNFGEYVCCRRISSEMIAFSQTKTKFQGMFGNDNKAVH
jgi:hypothetical protein